MMCLANVSDSSVILINRISFSSSDTDLCSSGAPKIRNRCGSFETLRPINNPEKKKNQCGRIKRTRKHGRAGAHGHPGTSGTMLFNQAKTALNSFPNFGEKKKGKKRMKVKMNHIRLFSSQTAEFCLVCDSRSLG